MTAKSRKTIKASQRAEKDSDRVQDVKKRRTGDREPGERQPLGQLDVNQASFITSSTKYLCSH